MRGEGKKEVRGEERVRWEIRKVVGKMKDRKAMEMDEVSNKA